MQGRPRPEVYCAQLPIPDALLWGRKHHCEWIDYVEVLDYFSWWNDPADVVQLCCALGITKYGG